MGSLSLSIGGIIIVILARPLAWMHWHKQGEKAVRGWTLAYRVIGVAYFVLGLVWYLPGK